MHDPTKWPTPMHGWTYWSGKANEYEKDMYEIRAGFEDTYGCSPDTDKLIRDDPAYQTAFGDQQFAECRANTFGHAVTIRLLEALLAEIRNPR